MNRIRTMFFHGPSGPLSRWQNVWLLVAILLAAGLSACSDTTATNEGNGELSIALTDAEGDFVSYTVDVVSLTLTKANGTVVETLPIKTRVDFAQYTDMTEFISIATIPAGVYVKGSMVLDYTNAEILVENAAGESVVVNGADIKDKDGNIISTMEMSVALEGRNHLVIVRGVPAHLTLDFDLDASNTVSFIGGTPSLAVEPYLLAEVNVEHHKPHRVRGPLKEVQLDAGKFQVYVRPFYHRILQSQRHFGVLNAHISDDTMFEIDGVTYQGTAGLEMLASMAQYSAVAVLGDLKHHPRRFNAKQVYAGSSVPGGDMDVTRGSVVSRSGDELTVKGMTFLRHNGAITFNDTVLVNLADSTTVLKALRMGTFNINDISVGQYVTVFGTVGTNGSDRTLDAANGYARMEISHLKASRSGTISPLYDFVLSLNRINGRDIAQYNFAGTGTNVGNDAQADSYEVDNGPLDVSAIATDASVRVRGHVRPFGNAPADFEAMTIIDLSANVIH